MSEVEESKKTSPKYLENMMKSAGKWYNYTKNTYPMIESGLSYMEPLLNPVSNAISKYAEPVIVTIDAQVYNMMQNIETAKLSFDEKKKLCKAAIKAWTEDHKNFSEFLDSIKRSYTDVWKDYFEEYALVFYNKSLNYKKKSGQMLRLAADILSEGSDNFRGSMYMAWKKVGRFSPSEYFTSLKELMGEKWNEGLLENARIFASISKLQKKLFANKSFVSDWKNKSRATAEATTHIILAGADELYFWSISTFNSNYSVLYKHVLVYIPFQQYKETIFSYFSEENKEKILAITWPETVKGKVTPVLEKVGLGTWTTKHWANLDKDEDGVVTIGDLYLTISQLQKETFESSKKFFIKITHIFTVNGEVKQ